MRGRCQDQLTLAERLRLAAVTLAKPRADPREEEGYISAGRIHRRALRTERMQKGWERQLVGGRRGGVHQLVGSRRGCISWWEAGGGASAGWKQGGVQAQEWRVCAREGFELDCE